MATYKVTGPDGRTYKLTGPDNASNEEIVAQLQKHLASAKPDQPEVSRLSAAARGALQGLTLNWGDELVGAVKAPFGKGSLAENYAAARDDWRKADKEAKASHPGLFVGGELAGGVVPFFVPGLNLARGATGAATIGAKMAQGARLGAGVGAVSGAGASEGGAENLALGAAGGAAAGGVLGGLIPPAADLASAVARKAVNPIRSLAQPQKVAAETVADRVMMAFNGQIPHRGDIAAVAPAGQNILADVGGKNTHGLMRAWLNRPNAARDEFHKMLDNRQALTPQRIEAQIGRTVGRPGDYGRALDDIVAQRRHTANQAYGAAFQAPFHPGDALASMFALDGNGRVARPTLQRVLDSVAKDLKDRGIRDPMAWSEQNKLQLVQLVKFKLDDKLRSAHQAAKMGNATTADKWDANTLQTLKDHLMDAVRTSHGDGAQLFIEANNKFAGDSALKSALEAGFEDAKKSLPASDITAKIAKMTPSEQDFYRMGHARHMGMVNAKGSKYNDRVKRDWESPEAEQRIAALARTPQDAAQFWRFMEGLKAQQQTRQAAQGNSTTALQLAEQEAADKPADIARNVTRNVMSGNFGALLQSIGDGVTFFGTRSPAVAAHGLRMLASEPGAATRSYLHPAVQQAMEALATSRARMARQQAAATYPGAAVMPAMGLAPGLPDISIGADAIAR